MQLSDEISFGFDNAWEKLPSGWQHLDVPDVSIGPGGSVYITTRKPARVIVYSSDGTFQRSFGEEVLSDRPHGIAVGADGTVYVADTPAHVVRVFDSQGVAVRTMGEENKASDTGIDMAISDPHLRLGSITHGGAPFNLPAGVAIGRDGDLYVADGYGNARIHHFDADGDLLHSWGEPGNGPGQFHLPHALSVLPDGRVVVADRENDRLQVFTEDGAFIDTWADVQRPSAVAVGPDGLIYVTELAWLAGERSFTSDAPVEQKLPDRLTVLSDSGEVVGRCASEGDPCAPDQIVEPHGIAVDSAGNVFIAEVTHTGIGRDDCHTFRRLIRL